MSMNFYFSEKTEDGWKIPYDIKILSPLTFNDDEDDDDYEGTPNPSYVRELDLGMSSGNAAELLSLFDIHIKAGMTPDLEVNAELIEKANMLIQEHGMVNNDLTRRLVRFRDFLVYGYENGYVIFYGA